VLRLPLRRDRGEGGRTAAFGFAGAMLSSRYGRPRPPCAAFPLTASLWWCCSLDSRTEPVARLLKRACQAGAFPPGTTCNSRPDSGCAGPVLRARSMIMKLFRAYSVNYLHQEQNIRDHDRYAGPIPRSSDCRDCGGIMPGHDPTGRLEADHTAAARRFRIIFR